MNNTPLFVDHILVGARNSGQRTGQYLFNHLPSPVARVVRGTMFDPFHKELSPQEIYDWIENHLIFDGMEIIACFNGDTLWWEAPTHRPKN